MRNRWEYLSDWLQRIRTYKVDFPGGWFKVRVKTKARMAPYKRRRVIGVIDCYGDEVINIEMALLHNLYNLLDSELYKEGCDKGIYGKKQRYGAGSRSSSECSLLYDLQYVIFLQRVYFYEY